MSQAIKGYRTLSPIEIEDINDVKKMAEKVGEMVALMQAGDIPDQRWVSIGKTHLQQGFMALTRAIAKPESF